MQKFCVTYVDVLKSIVFAKVLHNRIIMQNLSIFRQKNIFPPRFVRIVRLASFIRFATSLAFALSLTRSAGVAPVRPVYSRVTTRTGFFNAPRWR